MDRRREFSSVRDDATVRWPPKDGQPELTLAATLGQRAELEAPAAAGVSRESASSATNDRRASMMGFVRGLTFDMRGAQKAQPFGHPLDGRVRPQC